MSNLKISKTGLFRYHSVDSLEKLKKTKLNYIDMVEVEERIKDNNNPFGQLNPMSSSTSMPTMEVKVLTKEVDPKDIKTLKVDKYHELYEDILNFYVDNQLKTDKNLDIDYNEDILKIRAKLIISCNIVAQQSRVGPANIAIMSQKMYDKLKDYSINSFKYHINPTNIHNNKIIVVRLTDQMSDIGVSILSDNMLDENRYLKLVKIAKRMNIEVPSIEINYAIVPIGNKFQNTISVINILNYES